MKNPTPVTLHYRRDNAAGTASAFFQGEYEEFRGKKQEKFIWLPKGQIEVVHGEGDLCEVTMPEKLAIEKGLV